MIESILAGIAVELLKKAAARTGHDDAFALLADKTGVDLADRAAPWDKIHDLPDDPGTVYVWRFDDDISDERLAAIESRVEDEFVSKYSTEPRALHFFLRECEAVEDELAAEDVRELVEPWLRQQNL
ncbi:MAG: hypothetical protein SVU88_03500 [Candidatus Nanohaloarchaea archaeon]|nr:hypothetical protein [Candidatus Nanohaloarchaea archaeon]